MIDSMKYMIAMMLISVVAGCRPAAAPAGERTAAPKIATTIVKEKTEMPMNTEKATFAAGCFWGVEAAFRQVEGVVATSVGYTGGRTANPTYKEVCSDTTGHAEAVEVIFDPTKVTYEKLLDVFWESHDPTTMNRQGPDVGSQYRSAIFFHTPEQEAAARASKEKLAASGKYRRPIVTEVTKATAYFLAEEYHQQYVEKTGQAACGGH